MARFSSNYIKVSKVGEFKKVGKNDTPLLELELMEPIRKKRDGDDKPKTVGHNFFEATIWGDLAVQSTLDLEEGTVLDLSPEIISEDDGSQWVKHKANLKDESWTYQNKEYHKVKVVIYNYEIRD